MLSIAKPDVTRPNGGTTRHSQGRLWNHFFFDFFLSFFLSFFFAMCPTSLSISC